MAHHTDHELLATFVKNGSESAFSALVARYVNLVYSTALRHTGNPHHAEEVTQAVFIILARKAGSISSKVILTGWLYQAARLNAANHRRDNQRRQQREQQAIMESALNVPADEPWKLIAPLLDEAMNALGLADRDAVLLRYFENKPLAEIGAALGVSEAAAEKRVSRALERLHAILTRRGVAIGTTAISGAITANAVQAAPAALAVTITPAVLTATSLTSATVAMTTLQKIGVAAVLAATIGGGIYVAKQASDAHKEVRELQAQQAPSTRHVYVKPMECLTKDNKQLIMSFNVGWHVADAGAFAKSFPGNSTALPQRQLDRIIYSAGAQVAGLHNLSDFVNPDGSKATLSEMEKTLQSSVEGKLDRNTGIMIESVGINNVKQR